VYEEEKMKKVELVDTMTSAQILDLLLLAKEKRMNPWRFQAILNSGLLEDLFDYSADLENRSEIQTALRINIVLPSEFSISVDYDIPIDEVIRKSGCANYIQDHSGYHHRSSFTDQYDFRGKFERTMRLASKEESIEAGWRPAILRELLFFRSVYPHEQRKYAIYARGTQVTKSYSNGKYYRSHPLIGATNEGKLVLNDRDDYGHGEFKSHYLQVAQ